MTRFNNARAIQVDVSDNQSVKSCFSELEQDGGGLTSVDGGILGGVNHDE